MHNAAVCRLDESVLTGHHATADAGHAVPFPAKEDGTQAARTLSARMLNAIPRFEATEEVCNGLLAIVTIVADTPSKKRRRREYRQMRRAQFTRPEPGFSLYEGRTRGKRMRYTFDDDDAFSDDTSTRRSGRRCGSRTQDTAAKDCVSIIRYGSLA